MVQILRAGQRESAFRVLPTSSQQGKKKKMQGFGKGSGVAGDMVWHDLTGERGQGNPSISRNQ